MALNLRTRAYKSYDNAGVVTSVAYDFKGNPLRGNRQLAKDYKTVPDWAGTVELEPQVFSSSMTYDALNRPFSVISPDNSEIAPTYNEANLLERVQARLRGAVEWTSFVEDIDYNAKGQRELIAYGNGVVTTYDYDPQTFRLINLNTTRSSNGDLQNLSYTYDPSGNITEIRDAAQQTIYFRNTRVEPTTDYTYDALYQLIEATGREHLGQTDGQPNPPTAPDAFNLFHIGHVHPGDRNAMGIYRERYVYDAVGNILEMQHIGSDPAHPGWTRTYTYAEPSLIEGGTLDTLPKPNNRLSSTTVGASNPTVERYVHDSHGNMIRMPHLGGVNPAQNMHWDYRDQLRQTDLGGGGMAYYVYDAAGQRTRKIWEKAPGLIEERMYLGGFEIFRQHDPSTGSGQITLERETLHVMDDKQRIALIETKTIDTQSPVLSPLSEASPQSLHRYQLSNHLGSASVELNEVGESISYEEYFPYGSTSYQAVNAAIQAEAKRYRYTRKERDEETGLYYHGARYYAPWLGRWISCDPAGIAVSSDLYMYVKNNPIDRIDPTGMQDVQSMMSTAYWARMETELEGYITGWFGGQADVNISQNRVEYSGPSGGVGGVVGGPLRVASLRTIPIENNATTTSLMGLEFGAALVPIMDPSQRLALGTTVTGQPASRGAAAAELALDVVPLAVEFHLASIEARAVSLASRAAVIDRSVTAFKPATRVLPADFIENAVVPRETIVRAYQDEVVIPLLRPGMGSERDVVRGAENIATHRGAAGIFLKELADYPEVDRVVFVGHANPSFIGRRTAADLNQILLDAGVSPTTIELAGCRTAGCDAILANDLAYYSGADVIGYENEIFVNSGVPSDAMVITEAGWDPLVPSPAEPIKFTAPLKAR